MLVLDIKGIQFWHQGVGGGTGEVHIVADDERRSWSVVIQGRRRRGRATRYVAIGEDRTRRAGWHIEEILTGPRGIWYIHRGGLLYSIRMNTGRVGYRLPFLISFLCVMAGFRRLRRGSKELHPRWSRLCSSGFMYRSGSDGNGIWSGSIVTNYQRVDSKITLR